MSAEGFWLPKQCYFYFLRFYFLLTFDLVMLVLAHKYFIQQFPSATVTADSALSPKPLSNMLFTADHGRSLNHKIYGTGITVLDIHSHLFHIIPLSLFVSFLLNIFYLTFHFFLLFVSYLQVRQCNVALVLITPFGGLVCQPMLCLVDACMAFMDLARRLFMNR